MTPIEKRIEMTYLRQPASRWTFEQPTLRAWVESYCQGRVLNLFAGKTKLDCDEVRNDIDTNMPADFHLDAYEFVSTWQNGRFGTVILDPPYNLRKSREKYQGRWIGKFTKIKNLIPGIVNLGGRVITFGFDTVGLSDIRGFKKIAVCVVCHSGDKNDTLAVVEEKISEPLFEVNK